MKFIIVLALASLCCMQIASARRRTFLSERLTRPSTEVDIEDDDGDLYATTMDDDSDEVVMIDRRPTTRYVRSRPARLRYVRNRPSSRLDDDSVYERPVYSRMVRPAARFVRRDEDPPKAFSTSTATRGTAVSVAHTDGLKAYSTAFSSPKRQRQSSDDYVERLRYAQ